MMVIPNIIDPSVPIGKDDSENVEVRSVSVSLLFLILRFHITQTLWKALMVLILTVQEEYAGNGFYYLNGRYCKTSFCSSFLCQRFYD